MSETLPALKNCLECGESVEGLAYCPQCGQRNEPPARSVRAILGQYGEEVLALDGTLWKSLRPLIIHPGQLSREFLAGRRRRYVRPLRLYLLCSLTFFFLLGVQKEWSPFSDAGGFQFITNTDATADSLVASTDVADSVETEADDSNLEFSIGQVGWAPADRWLAERETYLESMDQEELIRRGIDTGLSALPRILFLSLPVFALLLYFLHFRQGRYYLQHWVFALHLHSFYFLLFTVALVLPWDWIDLILLLYANIYFVLAWKTAYAQSWKKSLAKVAIFGAVYPLILIFMLAIGISFTLLTL